LTITCSSSVFHKSEFFISFAQVRYKIFQNRAPVVTVLTLSVVWQAYWQHKDTQTQTEINKLTVMFSDIFH